MNLIKGAMLGIKSIPAFSVSNSGAFVYEQDAYLNRTPTVSGNRRTFTFSTWVKRTNVDTDQAIFSAGSAGSNTSLIRFKVDNELQILDGPSQGVALQTKAIFRDVSDWYHIVLVYDLDNAIEANRQEIYVNGVKQTLIGTFFAQNSNSSYFNLTYRHIISGQSFGATTIIYYMNSYLTETYFIDGQALTPDYFAETDPVTGQWNPKQYTGTYGTNGFYLDYKNGANLGDDKSGNSNNWTNNGVNPSTDTPTDNHWIINSLIQKNGVEKNGTQISTLFSYSGAPVHKSTIAIPSSGKYYFEAIHIAGELSPTKNNIGLVSNHWNSQIYYNDSGNKNIDGVITSYGSAWTINDVIGVAVDADVGEVTFYKNNVSQGAIAYDVYGLMITATDGDSANQITVLFNNTEISWTYPAPTGFKPLSSKNLPEPIITDSTKYFKALTYNDGVGSKVLGFQPDLVWLKSRSSAFNHKLVDSVRGATKSIEANIAAEATETTGLTSFDTNGFTVGADTDYSDTTGLGMIAWAWKKGVIPGFDIVTFVGTGVQRTVSHSLGVIPELILTFNLDSAATGNTVYHKDVGVNYVLVLNNFSGKINSSIYPALPTSTEFTVSDNASVNGLDQRILSYVFVSVEGFSKFGSYHGIYSTLSDGPYIYTGFRPACVIFKKLDGPASWIILDNVRDEHNSTDSWLLIDKNITEYTDIGNLLFFHSNGFKIKTGDGGFNDFDSAYIYIAFAESPFKYSRAK